jgi:hypothetical protein
MRSIRVIVFASLVAGVSAPQVLSAETVVTTDGRRITLNDDGTYAIEEAASDQSAEYLSFDEPFFTKYSGEYGQEQVRFMPIYTNEHDQSIVGLKFTATFRNAFGDEVFSFDGESNERVGAGNRSTANLFYYFEDNPFIGGEPYDLLSPLVINATGAIDVVPTAIVLEGGEVVRF